MLPNQLHIKLAPMCGGKTDYVLTEISRFSIKYKCLYINRLSDTRAKETIYSTHSTIDKKLPSNIMTVKTNDFSKYYKDDQEILIDINDYDAIFIDEGQFHSRRLIRFVKKLVDKLGKYVVVVGLDGDFNRKKFGYILDLIPLADSVEKLHAICENCGNINAIFSHRIVPGDEKVLVGGKEAYHPLCRKCYLNYNQKLKL